MSAIDTTTALAAFSVAVSESAAASHSQAAGQIAVSAIAESATASDTQSATTIFVSAGTETVAAADAQSSS
ncbi:MAG: hypothetical protein ACK5X3_20025, partial [Pseudomonadota bacterium]